MHSKTNRLSRVLPPALVAGTVVAAAILSVTGTARGAGQRATAAAIDVTQTCSSRVQPNATIQVQAVVSNTGDVQIDIPTGRVVGDAGTPLVDTDDFRPALLWWRHEREQPPRPGRELDVQRLVHRLTAEDETNIIDVDAQTTAGADPVNDLASCETDVVQAPAPGEIVGVSKVGGTVLVKKKGTTSSSRSSGPTEIPVGSQVDTTHGTIELVAGPRRRPNEQLAQLLQREVS